MKKITILLFLCLSVALIIYWVSTKNTTSLSESTSTENIYIPKDLDDAHEQLLKLMPPEEINRIKKMKSEDDMIIYHLGAGMAIRGSWDLWGDSKLAKYFHDLGVHHADDISGIIMNTFWCRIHKQPYRLEERVKFYQEFWKKRKEENKKNIQK